MVSTPHVVYADNRPAEVQPPNKVNDVEINEKPETLRGAIADAVYSKEVGGGVRKFYIPYFNIASGSPVSCRGNWWRNKILSTDNRRSR